jgi:glucose/mannose-6-phosphate isomerase
MTLDRPELWTRGDPHGVGTTLAAFPSQCREALALRAAPAPPAARPALVVAAGMGGSASGGDLLAACAAGRLDVPVLVHRGYGLPRAARAGTLVLASSYSGETVEVLSAVEEARARGLTVVVVTSGGRLGALAETQGLACVRVPSGLMPRHALAYLLLPAVTALAELGLAVASPEEVAEAIAVVAALAEELAPGRPAEANEAKRLALTLHGAVPVVYGGPETAVVATRWKNDLTENAKTFAAAGALPEMNHNEIEGWRAPDARALRAVLLRDRQEAPEIARRFAALAELIGPGAGGVTTVWARGQALLARLLGLAYLGQWTSYYLALLRGVDPWEVPLLDALKRRLAAGR